MTVEIITSGTIQDLDPLLPARTDYISEGDDHIKLIKRTVQNTFPNADVPLTSNFSDLRKITEYMEFKRDSGNSYNIVNFKEPTLLTNTLTGTGDTDVASVGVVKTLIKNYTANVLYRVGSYFISEDATHPNIALQLTGLSLTWERVTGFLAGIGNTSEGYAFVPGIHGSTQFTLTTANMPRQTINGNSFSTSGGVGTTNTPIGHGYASGPDSGRNGNILFNNPNLPRIYNATGTATFPAQAVTGLAVIGNTIPDPVTAVPTYRGVYIWRRTA